MLGRAGSRVTTFKNRSPLKETNMNDTTLTEIYELSGYEPQVIYAQMKWSAEHLEDKEACKLAAFEWGRKPKDMAFVWWNFLNEFRTQEQTPYTRHELMSLILIASLNKFERALLYQQWRDTTMSYEDVRAAVASRKQRKSKVTKAPTLADKLQAFICELEKESECGAGLELVCQRRAIADQLRGLLT